MASIIRVRMNSGGAQALLNSGSVRAKLTELAGGVLSAARSSAPVATGAYRNSLHIEQDSTDRVAVRVVADVDHAWIVEADHGVLARALDGAR